MEQSEIAAKLAFFSIGRDDRVQFSAVGKAVASAGPKALDSLYDRIAATPETARHFSSPAAMESARIK